MEIDNKIAERARRGVAVARRNWLFEGSRAGRERTAAMYNIIQVCQTNNFNTQVYTTIVIAKIANDWPVSRWNELMT